MPKLRVDAQALQEIKDFAITSFHKTRSFGGIDRQSMQQMLILEGLARWLAKHGVKVPFELEPELPEQTFEPVEDGE